ncbi:MAG: acyltransferase [Ferruginibacter sp.]
MTNQPSKTIYFNNLDALRFLSFLGVFITHTVMQPLPSNGLKGLLFSFITLDCLLVPFFFTLSSFLITYRLLTEKENNGGINLLKFYKNRILRIWPAYYSLIIACFILIPWITASLHVQQISLPSIIPFLFFYANFYIIENGSAFTFGLLILWSISIEEQFYLVWGWFLKFIPAKWITAFIALLFAFSIAFSYHYLFVQNKPATNLAIHSIFILQNFCTGALIAFIFVRKKRALSFLQTIPPVFFLLIYLILILSNYYVNDMILRNIIKSICYSLIIYDQALNQQRIFNAGKVSFINYLGKISYGMYLHHAILFVILQKQFHLFSYDAQPFIWKNLFHMLIAFIITFIVSHISYRYMESKFLKLKER